jgi:predicted ATPase/class 3 adenylate cyclase
MRELPSGTVTFLFTDVEGSTRLLERLGERYRDVLHGHHAIMRAAIAAGDGHEVATEGDSFFAVFPTIGGAVRATAQAQRKLARNAWPEGVAVRVRMGLHTGEGILGGDNYLGMDVHRAARIAGAAHGGQVLLSDATRALAEACLPPATRLRDLGAHRLKDLSRPERLYQLVLEGLEQDFPPARTLDARPNNLPAQLTRFFGRHDEIVRIEELLGGNRLVTLTGTGGTGKTRLALEVAARMLPHHGDGVFFVDLSSVADAELVPAETAAALGITEEPGSPLLDSVRNDLREKDLLLVLDNFEQVADAGTGFLEPLLHATKEVKALVTSRAPLHLYGEQQYPVPPLPVPNAQDLSDLDSLSRSEAVALFIDRARAGKPDFRVTADNARPVAEITARLDGLPLAIELAASRVKLLPPERLLARLEQRLPLLTARDRNLPDRQRTLRGAIKWSYELLDEAERRMFSRMAVFAGGTDVEAAEAVANPEGELGLDTLEGLFSLIDGNLLRSAEGVESEPRFIMLETIREYALERLAEGEEEAAVRRRHAQHWTELAEHAFEALSGPEQGAWTRRLEMDLDNFRSALSWVLRRGEAELGLRLGAALSAFWRVGSHVREGVRWLDALLAMPEASTSTPLRARALTASGELHAWINVPETYLGLAQEAVAIYRELGDSPGVAAAVQEVGWAQLQLGRLDEARGNLEEARGLCIGLGDRRKAAECSNGLGTLALLEDRPDQARPLLEEALETFKDLHDPYWIGLMELIVSQVDEKLDNLEAAERRIRAALSTFRQLDSEMGTMWALYSFAHLALHRGQHERALRLVGACDSLQERVGEMPALAMATMGDVAEAARSILNEATAESLYQEGLAMGLDEAVEYAFNTTSDGGEALGENQ